MAVVEAAASRGIGSIDFLRLWAGSTASGLGTWALPFVLGLAVLDGEITPVELGIVLAARTAGFLVAMPISGVLADRSGRRKVVLGASLIAAAAIPLIIAGLALPGQSGGVLMLAGAAIVGPSDSPGIATTVWGSDGSKWDAVGMDRPFKEAFDDPDGEYPTLRQEGQTVFRWAVWEMAKVAQQALDAAGITSDQLAAFIPHQANMRIIDEFAKQLKLPDHVVVARDIATTGNTSAASIPLATHRLLGEHPELSGGLALQIGFGAGLVYGAQVVRLP